MACSTIEQKQLKEAALNEYKRLAALAAEGKEDDLDNGIASIADAMKAMRDIVNGNPYYKEPVAVAVDTGKIIVLNTEKPKIGKVPVEIVSGTITDNNTVRLKIKYRSGEEDTIAAELITTNNKLVKDYIIYGSDSTSKAEGKYAKVVEADGIHNVEEMKKLFDTLVKNDSVKVNSEHASYLEQVMQQLINPALKAIPEVAIFINEQAKTNSGRFNMDEGIFINMNRTGIVNSTEKSAAEVLVHELVHAASVFVITYWKDKAPHQLNRLRKLRAQAMKEINTAMNGEGWKMFMPEVVSNREAEEKIAKNRWKYVFTDNNSLAEFLAYGMTNEQMRKQLERIMVYNTEEKPAKLIDQLMYYLKKLFDSALRGWRKESKDTTAAQAIHHVMLGFMQAQSKAYEQKEKMLVEKLFDKLDTIEDKVSDWIEKMQAVSETAAMTKLKDNATKLDKAKWWSNFLYQFVTNYKFSGYLENFLSAFGMQPEGLAQMTIANMKDTDDYGNIVQNLALQALQIDEIRENTAHNISQAAGLLFKKPLSKIQRKALQAGILRNDAATILAVEEGVELFKNKEARDNKIVELEKNIAGKLDEREARWTMFQVDGLVDYMLTGIGSEVQLKNATAIAMKLGTGVSVRYENIDITLRDEIDTLVTLKAINKTDSTVLEQINALLDEDEVAVREFSKMQKGLEEYLRNKENVTEIINEKKGRIRETYDKYVTSAIAPVDKLDEMRKKGYKLVKKLPMSKYDLTNTEMALYASKDMIKQPYNKQAMHFVGEKQQGRTLFEHNLKTGIQDVAAVTSKGMNLAKKATQLYNSQIMEGVKPKMDYSVVPEYDERGTVREYRYNVSMEDKLDYLGLEEDGIEAIGRGYAHQVDVERSEENNKIVWEEMLFDMANKTTSGRHDTLGKKYVPLDGSVDNQIMRDIMYTMPKSVRKAIKELEQLVKDNREITDEIAAALLGNRWATLSKQKKKQMKEALATGKLWVRRDMLLPLFGFRDVSITNAMLVKELPLAVKTLIRKSENWWKEIVSLYKVDVVIKTLPVITGNIISNLGIGVITGGRPTEIIKDMVAAWNELTAYMKMQDRLVQIKAEYAVTKDKSLLDEQARLQNDMDNSFIKPLIDAGLYTQIIEEADTLNYQSSNRIADIVQGKLDRAPEIIKNGVNFMYVTEKTALFQAVHMATAKSDFVARYAQYRIIKKRNARKFENKYGRAMTSAEQALMEKNVLNEIRDMYINYAKPDAAWLQWANDMGFVMFTKYVLRIQRIIELVMQGHPIRAAAALFGQEAMVSATGWEPDDISEKALLTNGIGAIYAPDYMKMFESLLVPQMVTNVRSVL